MPASERHNDGIRSMIFACACLSENHSVGNAFANKHVCSRCLEVIETVETHALLLGTPPLSCRGGPQQ